jgi:hypothetical protein
MFNISVLNCPRFRFPHLSNGWESDKSNRGYPSSRNIKTHPAAATATTT